jgi:iron complex transport system substrate-binding protein
MNGVSRRRALVKSQRIMLVSIALCIMMNILCPLRLTATTDRTTQHGTTRMITDMTGRQVKVPDPLSRVALFGGPTGQVAYALGAQRQLCAVTGSLKGSELVGSFDPSVRNLPAPRSVSGQVNVEELLLADCQMVIAGNLDGSIVEKKTGLPVAYTESSMKHGYDLLKKEVRFYGSVFQKETRAEKYVQYLEKTIAFLKARTKDIPQAKRKLVFNGYGPGHLVTLGGDTFMHERIEVAGCIDATAAISTAGAKEGLHSGFSEMSMERVLGWNPDILIIDTGTPEDVYRDSRWKSVKAIEKRNVFRQPVGAFVWDKPTVEAGVLYPLWLAKLAYPERFKDLDMQKEIKRFYREIMSFELSDVQAQKVLAGKFTIDIMPSRGKR